ncbi:MAG: hypothetical protein COB49_09950 [Alphaproteobacteria bacterium]|nr:MAG: hypothetical protein COB49_09950 [Alphaproteobacteria bacterium]
MLLGSGQAEAGGLSGELWLDNQDIFVSGRQKYHGQFDLRSRLPMDDEFILSKVTVSFKFQDDREWVSKAGPHSLTDTGKVIRHRRLSLRKSRAAGQTDHYYTAKSIIYLTNEEEVAELAIGRNIYYATTMRRRDVTRESLGQKSIILGTYSDSGDNHRIREHHRITESVVEPQRDGFDGLFAIRQKNLDLAVVQDLAHRGVLDFELGGKGDYIFVEATLKYEGYVTGPEVMEDTAFSGSFWLALFGLPIGGGLFWRKRMDQKNQKRITRRKIPAQRAF